MSKIRHYHPTSGLVLRVTNKRGQTRPKIRRSKIHDQTTVAPHHFERLNFFRRGECRHCYLAKHAHPVTFWSLAR